MINRYKTKPCEISALQWNDNKEEIKEFCGSSCFFVHSGLWSMSHEELISRTLEGDMRASKGDYIIRGLKGEFYPCKPDVFEKKYELIK